jgi:hypothetical protein
MNHSAELNETYRTESYQSHERSRVRKLYSRKKHVGFASHAELADWWIMKIEEQKGCCAYCLTSIGLINKLINAGLLKTRNANGGQRGPCLELERKNASGRYTRENCALICYYCNNDKSYIYSEDEYRKFFAPARASHFKYLAQQMS